MKTAIYRTTMFAALAAALTGQGVQAADDPETSWRGQPGSSRQEWRFDTGSNPHAAEVCQSSPSDKASMAPGQFALGWQNQLPGLGDATGFWDLGRSGTITAALPPFVTDPSPSVRYVLVSVCQYQDGGIYSEYAAVTIPGATFRRTEVDFTAFGPLGEWTVDRTLWRVEAGVSAGPLTITGAGNGSIVDLVVVEAGTPTSAPALLTIRRAGSDVEVAWSVELQGFVLESNTNLGNPQGWQPVDAPVMVVGNEQLVRLAAGDSARFFRLRKP
jgi:hypothetical protein